MRESDETLVARLKTRDPAALGDFLKRRRPQLLAYIERRLGPGLRTKVEPDDILQDVGVEALRSLPRVELGDRDPFGWLCQIVQRRIVDAHRRHFGAQKRAAGREVPLTSADSQRLGAIDMLAASMTTASAAFSRNEREMRFHAALAALPEDHRNALRLRYLEGLPSKEVAQRLGKTDGAVRVMLTRSLQKLQRSLEETAP